MIHTVRVSFKNEKEDGKGISIFRDLKQRNGIAKIRTHKLYRLEGITKIQAELLVKKIFCEDINQKYSIDTHPKNGESQTIEIGYKPGVMNPEVASIIKSAHDLRIKLTAADASWEYEFFGNLSKQQVKKIAEQLKLYNTIVEHIVEEKPQTLLIKGAVGRTHIVPLRNADDEQLMTLSKDKLFLNLEEMKVIQNYYKKINRDPIDAELETLAQTWSEHCAHKTFKAKLIVDGKSKKPLIERIQTEALKHKKYIISAFVDNSGVMDFYDGLAICGKAETHNSPSAIEPYGGAMTGSGGVFRDVVATGQGAKCIVSTDIFCFAKPDMPYSKLPAGCLPPDYLLKRCVAAVGDYGNRVGIPTNNGSFHFHDDFRAKPTVLVGAYGIIPEKRAQKGKPKKGDIAVAIGGRTGRDGIHGATFSSAEMTDRTISVNSTAVQIGNAIEEKRTFDAILEAREKGCIRAMQDCGAGGFSSAFGEMGQETGITIHLEKALLKYEGLAPWEIWISESQERMALAIPKNKLKTFLNICKKWNVEACVLGRFDGTKKLNVFYKKTKVCDLSMEFLHHGLPQRTMKATHPVLKKQYNNEAIKQSNPKTPRTSHGWITVFKNVLSHPNICSKESIVRLYDHTVQGTNALSPYSGEKLDGPQNAAVIKPLLNKPYGMIISHGLNPVLNNINPYTGSLWAAIEALSNYVAVGGDYKQASLINNYIWPFPDEESLWTLDKSVDAVTDLMKEFKIPVISGKDSLSSTYRGKDGKVIKIPPVLCISVFGKIPDISKTITTDFKKEDSVIVLVGKLDHKNMGGSIYFDVNNIPKIDLKQTAKIFDAIHKGICSQKILSAHDISEGGFITALFEMCSGGNLGAKIDLKPFKDERSDFVLFNEAAGRFLVEVKDNKTAKKLFKGVPFTILGETTKEQTISVGKNKRKLFQSNLTELKKSWQKPMIKYFS